MGHLNIDPVLEMYKTFHGRLDFCGFSVEKSDLKCKARKKAALFYSILYSAKELNKTVGTLLGK